MLYGRREERALIVGVLEDARRGHSGVLVVRGEAGIGKHSLLQDAAGQASDFQTLRGAGVEAEVELPFSALHLLLRPVLDRLARLPAPQASALRGILGLADTQPNRFLVQLGVLGLLVEVAAERPLLCLVADAQCWTEHRRRCWCCGPAAGRRADRVAGSRLRHHPSPVPGAGSARAARRWA